MPHGYLIRKAILSQLGMTKLQEPKKKKFSNWNLFFSLSNVKSIGNQRGVVLVVRKAIVSRWTIQTDMDRLNQGV